MSPPDAFKHVTLGVSPGIQNSGESQHETIQTTIKNPVSPQTATTIKAPQTLCREIPFEIVSRSPNKLRHVPVTSGLCLPKGELTEPGDWLVEGIGGAHLPVQTEVLNRWSDGSIRWLLAHFVAGRIPAGRTSGMLVRPGKRAQHHAGTASLRWKDDLLTLNLQQTREEDPTAATIRIAPEMIDQQGRSVSLHITDVTEEVSGDVCSISTVTAVASGLPFVEVQLRLEIWPTAGLVRVETRIRNTRRARHKGGLWDLGDEGSFHFTGLHLNIHAVDAAESTLSWKSETNVGARRCQGTDDVSIRQLGSGGMAWANTNHIDGNGKPTVRDRGYIVQSPEGSLRGHRAEPVVTMQSTDSRLSIAMPEFWQQFPSSLAVQNGRVIAGLFPQSDGQCFELQGGEQKTLATWLSIRPIADDLSHMNWVYEQPRLIQPASWINKCNVFSWQPMDINASSANRFTEYLTAATTGDYSFSARREKIDEYGWRNFGDVPADHEQAHYAGENTVISHYNNQFDLILGGILNMSASGDAKWFDLFEPLARHVMDIDIYHTTEDRACFNGGLFWHTDHYVDARTSTHRTYSKHNASGDGGYGGGPSNEHNYTTGLLYYYFLTGSREAYESIVSLADWVIHMDDGTTTIWGAIDSGPSGLASKTVFEDFHGPGRGAGNSINSLVDGWTLTGSGKYLTKAEELIRRVVSPNQNCDELHLADAEGHWSYTVCMTALGRYLAAKLEAEQFDENYAYVRETLANFGTWMAANEKPALSEPEKLEYPNVAWAAQEFRKANALRIAASCTDDTVAETAMRRKADELNDAAWKDLYRFDDSHLTARCLSILMTEGLRDVFHRTCRPEYMPPVSEQYDWSEWKMFVFQKHRVKAMLKNPAKAMLAASRLIHPGRLKKTIDAFRRQF